MINSYAVCILHNKKILIKKKYGNLLVKCVHVLSQFSPVQLFSDLWTVAQSGSSVRMRFSRQE